MIKAIKQLFYNIAKIYVVIYKSYDLDCKNYRTLVDSIWRTEKQAQKRVNEINTSETFKSNYPSNANKASYFYSHLNSKIQY